MSKQEKVLMYFACFVTAFAGLSQVLCPDCYTIEAIGAILGVWSIFAAYVFINFLIRKHKKR